MRMKKVLTECFACVREKILFYKIFPEVHHAASRQPLYIMDGLVGKR
jgi:hypothetical protein